MMPDPEIAFLRRREAEEVAAAARSHCMARTAHEDLAEEYAEQADELTTALAYNLARMVDLLQQLDRLRDA